MKLRKLLGIMLLAGGVLAGCQNTIEEPVVMEPEKREIADNEPEEKEEVEDLQIVAGSVSVTNVLGELDIDLVGIPTTDSAIPEKFEGLPEVGIAHTPDLEIVASLEPDLFILDANFREANEVKLDELGINAFFFETGSYNVFLESIASLGTEINREEEVRSLIDLLNHSAEAALENKTDESPRVAIIFGAGDDFMLATEHSYVGELAKIMGATNIAAELEGGLHSPFLQFSLEQILDQDPDYILRFAHGPIEQTEIMFNQMFDENDAFQQLNAVQNGKVVDLDSTIFGTAANLRAPEAFEKLGEIFYGN